jgi:hypothetical protein
VYTLVLCARLLPGPHCPLLLLTATAPAPGGGLAYNFKSSEPQNPQKAQKNQNSLARLSRRSPKGEGGSFIDSKNF